MATCNKCKHWELAGKCESGHSVGLGRCTAVPLLWDATEWAYDGDSRVLTNEYKNTKAFAQDGSDYRAHLLTMPDFGCVSHQPDKTKE